MNYAAAYHLVLEQAQATDSAAESLLTRLKQCQPPVPGQITSLLLALKVVFEALKDQPILDRELVAALYQLAIASRTQFEAGRRDGVDWPPLLDEDLTRIERAIASIFSGQWQGASNH